MNEDAERNGADVPASPNPRRRSRWLPRSTTRRARTLAIGVAISAVLLVTASAVPVPYVGLGPGSTFNTLASANGHDIINFSGQDVPPVTAQTPSGALDMVTIRVIDRIPLIESVAMWISGRYELAPRDDYYPPDKTKQEVKDANVALFQDSQSKAEIVALTYLNYPKVVYVGTIEKGSPSWGALHPQDQIVGIDGHEVTNYESLASLMAKTSPGHTVLVSVLRDDETLDKTVTLGAQPDDGPQGFLGVGVVQRPTAPFTITISLEDIGGPSAGMMFTLGIIDRLTPGDLTGGKHIAGTGTIGLDGRVGPIGGVSFKARAAQAAGAEYLLVPQDNCAEVMVDPPAGLVIAAVSTIDDAVAATEAIAKDEVPSPCPG